jgi:hypothetical protein
VTWTEATARAAVRTASAGRCQLQVPAVCQVRAAGVHHRAKRSHGGRWHPANLVDACGSGTTGCHGWTEANPAVARELGWWLQTGDGDPLEVPAYLWTPQGRAWWLWADDGTTSRVELPLPTFLAGV